MKLVLINKILKQAKTAIVLILEMILILLLHFIEYFVRFFNKDFAIWIDGLD